eukprot:4274659-Prymnesium_polylepis.1
MLRPCTCAATRAALLVTLAPLCGAPPPRPLALRLLLSDCASFCRTAPPFVALRLLLSHCAS